MGGGLAALLWVWLVLPACAQDLAGAAVQSGRRLADLRVTIFYTDRLELTGLLRPPPRLVDTIGLPSPPGSTERRCCRPRRRSVDCILCGDRPAPGRTYYVSVRNFLPAHAGQPTDLTSAPALLAASTRADARVLVAVYFAADNDLSPYIRLIRERLARGTAGNPNADVVFLADGDRVGDTVLWEIAGGTVTATNVVSAVWVTCERTQATQPCWPGF